METFEEWWELRHILDGEKFDPRPETKEAWNHVTTEKNKEIAELKKELDQQKFNNKHNLSIDQSVSDKIKELKHELEEARATIEWLQRES